MKILIIGGGVSAEREISLRSANAVLEAARSAGYDAEFYDWDGSEGWLGTHTSEYDVALPILHGEGGEDGQIQSILEKLGIPFVGTGSTASKVCIDKQTTREQLMRHGILVPKGVVVDVAGYTASKLSTKPHVLKPLSEGSSVDTFIVPSGTEPDHVQIEKAFDKHKTMLLEEYIDGVEITVPYLEGHTLPVIEIIPPSNEVFDYANKYNGKTVELCPPQHISEAMQEQAQMLGAQVHKHMGCRDLSRTDMIVVGGKLYVLEINTMPGLTNESLFPLAAKQAGLDMPELVDTLINIARSHA